jgi:hypothetical protein
MPGWTGGLVPLKISVSGVLAMAAFSACPAEFTRVHYAGQAGCADVADRAEREPTATRSAAVEDRAVLGLTLGGTFFIGGGVMLPGCSERENARPGLLARGQS